MRTRKHFLEKIDTAVLETIEKPMTARNPHWRELTGKQKRFVILWYQGLEENWTNAEIYRKLVNRPDMSTSNAAAGTVRMRRHRRVMRVMNHFDAIILRDATSMVASIMAHDIDTHMFDPRDAVDENGDFHPLNKMPRHAAKMIKKARKIKTKLGDEAWEYEFRDPEPSRQRLAANAGYGNMKRVEFSGQVATPSEAAPQVDPQQRAKQLAAKILAGEAIG